MLSVVIVFIIYNVYTEDKGIIQGSVWGSLFFRQLSLTHSFSLPLSLTHFLSLTDIRQKMFIKSVGKYK